MSTELSPEESAVAVDGSPQPTPGEFLMSERQQRGYSRKEVADKLYITVHYINAIETDAYQKLPGVIFVRGHMKRYAEMLGLDNADDVLRRLEDYQQAQQGQETAVTRTIRKERQARNRILAIVSVILFAGIFTGLWVWNQVSSSKVEISEETAVTADVPAQISNAQPGQQGPDSVATGQADPSLQAVAAETAEALDTPGEIIAVAEVVPITTISTDQAAATEQVDGDVSDIQLIAVSNRGDDVLRVSFSDESFIQVSDENSNRIYRGTLGRGEVLEITDIAPFDVLLGDAPLVRLTLNGNAIDVSDSIRIDNSARLTVGLPC